MTLRTPFGKKAYTAAIASLIVVGAGACTISSPGVCAGMDMAQCMGTAAAPDSGAKGGAEQAAADGSAGGKGGAGDAGESNADGSASGGDGGTPAGAAKIGTVFLSSTTFTVGQTTINSHSASAFFSVSGAAPVGGAACTTSTDGACTITECTVAAASDAGADASTDAGAPVKPPNAGDIAISGGAIAAAGIKLVVGSNGSYAPNSGQTKLWAGGEDIAIKASGADVPAFDQKVTAPSLVTLTAPTFPAAGAALNVDRSKDLNVSWSGGVAGDVLVSLTGVASGKTASVSCKFLANANKGTVTATALGKLPPVAASPDFGSVSVSSQGSNVFKQDDWNLSLTATSIAKTAAGLASGTAKFQ